MSAFRRIRNMFGVAISFIVSLCLCQCSQGPGTNSSDSTKDTAQFLFISHTRLNQNNGVHPKVYQLDFSQYEYLLLGGDMAEKSFENEQIISHLDSIFNISSERTLWSVGNHDRVSNTRFAEYTGKNKYGIHQTGDLSFVVLDSQDSLSSIVGKQRDFLFKTLDTLTSKKVIFMSHKLIFMDQHPIMDSLINEVCNGKKGDCYYCHNRNNFQEEIYPKLEKLRGEGKQVMWIGGDLGRKTSKFQFVTDDGIIFLGNGMDPESKKNYILEILNNDLLSYRFVDVDSLILNGKSLQNLH